MLHAASPGGPSAPRGAVGLSRALLGGGLLGRRLLLGLGLGLARRLLVLLGLVLQQRGEHERGLRKLDREIFWTLTPGGPPCLPLYFYLSVSHLRPTSSLR